MIRPTLDVQALYEAVDKQRREQRISYREVARVTGISPSTFSRLGHGFGPDANGLIQMLAWLGTTDLAPYVRAAEQPEDGERR